MEYGRLLLVCVLILSVAGGFAVTASASDYIPIDEDHGLNEEEAIEEYEETGSVERDLDRLDMTIGYYDDPCEAGVDQFLCETNNEYLYVEYNEDIDREVRLLVKDEYITERQKADVEGEESEVTADFYPSDKDGYTVVELQLEGETEDVIEINWAEGTLWDIRGGVADGVEDLTGFETPGNPLATGDDWSYVDPVEYEEGEQNVVHLDEINERSTVQYNEGDVDEEVAEDRWITVPDCDDPSEQHVCTYTVDGEDGVFVMSTMDDAPQVRFADGVSPVGGVSGAANELVSILSDILDRIPEFE